MSQWVWKAKKPSLLNGHECRVPIYVKICSPSPVMGLSPYEWKILEWDENPTKQTNILVNPRHCIFKGNSKIQKIILIHWQSYRVRCTFMNKGDQPIKIGPLIQGWSSLHVLIFVFCIPLHIRCIQTYWKKICSLYHRFSVKIMYQIYSFIYYLYMIFIHKNFKLLIFLKY